ncbi:alpha/beta hydrolase [Streptococcus cuniculipharyngis]|uniref:Alpha/beta hydrolase n=1 Tax=Streptococcus cuniculipharyngis TaxID=1562651 RepID=A0A5C5SEF2_9STRE|nr:alpha/beta hydrolase [Streptococcus cuniculipharyngis]TWS98670.1 alpha/beta hydrolase [Streptococcus cuniculipharyngis]
MKKYLYLLIALLFLGLVWLFLQAHVQVKTQPSTEQANLTSTKNSLATSTPSVAPKPSQELENETYTVDREQITLYGKLTAPKTFKQEKRPLVIIAHGFNNTLDMYDDYAQYLAKLGYVVYSFDFYGGSTRSRSGGTDMLNMSVLTQEADLAAVVNKLSQESFIDTRNISLLGVSQGGVVSTLYAADNPQKISKLLLIFPAFVLFDDVKETYNQLGVASPDQLPAIISHRNAQLGSIYLTDALTIDIKQKMQAVNQPVLIIQGTDDQVVPYSYAQEASNLFPQATLVTVPEGQHWIDQAFNQIALPALTEFLIQNSRQ